MAPLVVLIIATLLARLIGQIAVHPLRDFAAATRAGLAVMLFFTAAAHFNSLRPDMIAMVPPFVPNPQFMVTFTGICEVLGALGILVPPTRRVAAGALILYMFAVLPANIYAAQTALTLGGAPVTPLIPRVALQLLFIGLLWWSGVRPRRLHDAADRKLVSGESVA